MASIITGDSVKKMAVSVEEEKRKKSFTLKKSEEAFNAAKVKINHYPFIFFLY